MGLLLFIFLCSPIFLLIIIIMAVSNGHREKEYNEQINILNKIIDYYSEKYGKLTKRELKKIGIEENETKEIFYNDIKKGSISVDEDRYNTLMNSSVATWTTEDHDFIYWYRQNQNNNNTLNKYKEVKSTRLEKRDNKSEKSIASKQPKEVAKTSSNKRISQKEKNTTFNEYIKRNNITNGNIIFALGILFISAAGLVFATTTWHTIPNIFKVLILLLSSLVLLLLSNLANNKFKLIKTSITLYILFSILISIIPISLGFFRMLGDKLTMGGRNEFLLYAISILVLIISYLFGIKIYNKKELIKFVPYAINVEILLIILNFTKSYDLILLILSIYNLFIFILTKIKSINIEKRTKEILYESSKYSLIALSVLSIMHLNVGNTYAFINIIFAFLFMFNAIEFKEKEVSDIRFILSSIFIVLSGIRIDSNFLLEYYSTFFIIISLMYLFIKNFDDNKFIYLFYILGITQLISTAIKFTNSGISLYLVISMFIMITSLSLVLKKKKDNVLMSFKTIYFLIFTYILTCFIVNDTKVGLKFIMIQTLVILFGQIVSNLLNENIIKNKFTNLNLNVLYRILFPCIFIYYTFMFYSDAYNATNYISIIPRFEKYLFIILINIYIIVYFFINLWIDKIYKNDKKINDYIELNAILYVIMFLSNLIYEVSIYVGIGRLIIEPYHIIAIILLSIIYYYIVKKNIKMSASIIPILFIVLINKIAYLDKIILASERERFFILLIGFVITFLISEFYKYKNTKIFKNIITIVVMIINLIVVTIFDFGFSLNSFYPTIFSLIINLLIIYIYFNYNEYKNIIRLVLPFSILGFNIYFINLISNTYLYRVILSSKLGISNALIITSILYMILNIISIYRDKLSDLTKYFNIYILSFLSISMVFINDKIFRSYEIRILTIYFTTYLILYIINRLNKNNSKNIFIDKFINYIFILQFILMEIEIFTEFYEVIFKLVLMNNNLYYRNLDYYTCFVFIITINFVIWFIINKIKSYVLKLDKKEVRSFNVIYDNILPKILYISIILCFIQFARFLMHYYYVNINTVVILSVSAILMILYMNVLSTKIKYYNLSKLFIIIIPYLLTSYFLAKNNNLSLIITIFIFFIYVIMSIFYKSDYFRIKYKDLNLSLFSISNIFIFTRISDIYNTFGSKHYTFNILIILSIFALQFLNAYKNDKFNKHIHSFSLLLFMIAIIMQQFIIISKEFYPEYISVIICVYVFILDKIIYKFDKEISDLLWLITEGVIGLVLFIRIISYKLIINTLIYGIMSFILLIVSYIFKKYKNFVLSTIMLILLLIYVTRKFWLSIAWWVYLLVVGILLILFATKNEQLKKENKSMKMVLDDNIDKLKKWINR